MRLHFLQQPEDPQKRKERLQRILKKINPETGELGATLFDELRGFSGDEIIEANGGKDLPGAIPRKRK